jgi:hypothetical protein
MAKTTRKTEETAAEKKPAARRTKTATAAAGVKKTATRTRKKADAPGSIPAVSAREVANLGQPVQAPRIPAEPTHDEIALRAWSIYESRGGGHGQAFDDWVEAKRQLYAERGLEG